MCFGQGTKPNKFHLHELNVRVVTWSHKPVNPDANPGDNIECM